MSTRAGSVRAEATKALPSSSTRSPLRMLWPTCATSPLTLTRPSAMRCSSARREPSPAWASTLCRRSSIFAAGAASSLRLRESLPRVLRGVESVMGIAPAIGIVRGLGYGTLGRGGFGGVGGVFVGGVAGLAGGRIGRGGPIRVAAGIVGRGAAVVGGTRVVLRLRLAGLVGGETGSGRRRVRIQRQFRLQLADVLQFGQGRQFVQALEPEVVQERLGGAVQGRAARHVAVADHADPLALFQRLDDVAADRHAA